MSGTFVDLESLSYTRIGALLASADNSVALIPAGSVEAHGPHLPLATDTLISVEVAGRAGRALAELGFLAVRFPPLAYGVTDWAEGFTGTVSLDTHVIEQVLLQTCEAAITMGFTHIVLTNAHLEPGHIATLRRVEQRFAGQTPHVLFVDKTRRKQAERLTAEFRSGSCHAGQYETSLMLAIAPQWVDMDAARELPGLTVALHERIAAGARNFSECGLEQAYCGTPAAATPEEGERSLAVLGDMVVEAVLATTNAGPPGPQSAP